MAPMWVNLQIDFKFITRKKLIRYTVHVLAAGQNGHNPKRPQSKTATTKRPQPKWPQAKNWKYQGK